MILNFVEKVYDKQNILILLELDDECVIGGYTSTGWKKSIETKVQNDDYIFNMHELDKNAFLFHLKSAPQFSYDPFISNVKQDEYSISNALTYDFLLKSGYGMFGIETLICIDDAFFQGEQRAEKSCYEQFKHGHKYLSGEKEYHCTPTVEVFQILFQ